LATIDPQSLPADPAARAKRLEDIQRNAEGLANLFPQPGDNFQVGVAEAMLFNNNENLLRDLLVGPGKLPARLKEMPDVEKRVDLAVRMVLGRPPRLEEIQTLSEYLRRRQDRPEAACQQMVWALLTSAEFRFNH
jgi:hypothetical protein